MENKNIPLRAFSDYFLENISTGGYNNQIQITSLCNAKCVFCSNEQNPFKIERCGFRDIEEIKKIIWATPSINGEIALNESLPGRISEGEAFLHPKFFDILHEIRKKYNNIISISTNGSFLTEDFIKQLAKFNPVKVTISFPSANKENWKNTFKLNDEAFHTTINSFEVASKHDLIIRSSMVPMPSWFGWEDLEKTISFLSKRTSSILVYSPGYTKFTSKDVVDKLVFDKTELTNFLDNMVLKYNTIIDWSLHPMINLGSVDQWSIKNLLGSTSEKNHKSWWLTSEAAYDRFNKIMEKASLGIPANYDVIKIKNHTYGGNIECMGLWTFNDIRTDLNEILKNKNTPNVIFMNDIFMDKYGFDLIGHNVVDFMSEYPDIFFHIFRKD